MRQHGRGHGGLAVTKPRLLRGLPERRIEIVEVAKLRVERRFGTGEPIGQLEEYFADNSEELHRVGRRIGVDKSRPTQGQILAQPSKGGAENVRPRRVATPLRQQWRTVCAACRLVELMRELVDENIAPDLVDCRAGHDIGPGQHYPALRPRFADHHAPLLGDDSIDIGNASVDEKRTGVNENVL